jgi:hypothetical protein
MARIAPCGSVASVVSVLAVCKRRTTEGAELAEWHGLLRVDLWLLWCPCRAFVTSVRGFRVCDGPGT